MTRPRERRQPRRRSRGHVAGQVGMTLGRPQCPNIIPCQRFFTPSRYPEAKGHESQCRRESGRTGHRR
jgi:hypothetical protein